MNDMKTIVNNFAKEYVRKGWNWKWSNGNKSSISDSITVWDSKNKLDTRVFMVQNIVDLSVKK
jgi:hypothetical protein